MSIYFSVRIQILVYLFSNVYQVLSPNASYPAIEFVDDRDGNQFKCIIKRCERKNR